MDYIILWSFFLEFHEKQDIKKTTRTNSQLSLNISENEDESDVKQVCFLGVPSVSSPPCWTIYK